LLRKVYSFQRACHTNYFTFSIGLMSWSSEILNQKYALVFVEKTFLLIKTCLGKRMYGALIVLLATGFKTKDGKITTMWSKSQSMDILKLVQLLESL
jgi:hypothetical protein